LAMDAQRCCAISARRFFAGTDSAGRSPVVEWADGMPTRHNIAESTVIAKHLTDFEGDGFDQICLTPEKPYGTFDSNAASLAV